MSFLNILINWFKQKRGKSNSFSKESVSLSQLIRDATPSKRGLYPHEILMLYYAPKYKNMSNNFPKFWLYDCSVKEPQKILVSLYERGFLQLGGIAQTLERLTVKDIKRDLKELNQKNSGTKTELIRRLMVAQPKELLLKKYPDRYYALTALGRQELEENQYFIEACQHSDMSIWEINREISKNPQFSYRDKMWQNLSDEAKIHFNNGDFGLYRNSIRSMCEFLQWERKYQAALALLCQVIAFDFSLLDNNMPGVFDKEDKNGLLKFALELNMKRIAPYKDSGFKLPPGITRTIVYIQKNIHYSDAQLKNILIKHFSAICVPYSIFTVEEIIKIIFAEKYKTYDKLEQLYIKAQQRARIKIMQGVAGDVQSKDIDAKT